MIEGNRQPYAESDEGGITNGCRLVLEPNKRGSLSVQMGEIDAVGIASD